MTANQQSTVLLEPSGDPSYTVTIQKVRQLGSRRLTRAHLALRSSRALADEVAKVQRALAQALTDQLGRKVELEGRLIDSALNPFGSLARSSGFALLELAQYSDRAIVEVDLPLLSALLGGVSGRLARPVAPGRFTRIEEAALAYLVLVALETVRAAAGTCERLGPRLLSVHAERGEVLERTDCQRRFVAVDVQVRLEGRVSGRVRLWLPAHVMQSAVAVEAPPVEPLCGPLADTELVARAVLHGPVLSVPELCGLRDGDVVVIGGRRQSGWVEGEGRLCASAFHLTGHFGQDGFTTTGMTARHQPPEERMQPSRRDEQTWPQAQGLPVELEVELARVALPLGQLAGLKPGAVVPLKMNAAESVLLRVAGRAFARAELVDIEGELGVRVLQLLS